MDKKKIILIVSACCIVIYLDYNLILKKQLGGISALKPKITQLKQDIENLNKDLAMIEDLKAKQAKQPEKGASRIKRIVSEGGLPSLLEEISSLANKNSVKIKQIKPLWESKKDEKVKAAQKSFAPLLIAMDLSCDYHHLGGFIGALENNEYFMAVENLRIVNEGSNFLQQKVSLALKTYVKQ